MRRPKNFVTNARDRIKFALPLGLLLACGLRPACEAAALVDILDKRDVLDRAVLPVDDLGVDSQYGFNWIFENRLSHDDNLYRLPDSVRDVAGLAGPGATRSELIDSSSAGASDRWELGRQSVSVNLEAAYNHFFHNAALSNVSSSDQVVWDWRVGERLSGKLGADYAKFLTSFVNSNYFGKDMLEKKDYFGAGRYQLGPHLGTFAGVLYTSNSFSAPVLRGNDYHSEAVDLGIDLATSINDSFGFAYRNTDAHYPTSYVLNGMSFDPDYREKRARLFAKYAFSEKTVLDGTVGYLKRSYPSTAIGSFAGTNWRVAVSWDPTAKIRWVVEGRRDLDAYLTSQTDYYVSKSITVSPTWAMTEKLNVSLAASWDDQKYIGTNLDLGALPRKDKVVSEKLSILYKPLESINVTGAYGNDNRDSNQPRFHYKDRIISIDVALTFR